MSHDWIFQHDNDPKHRAAIVANWLNKNSIERLHWPLFLPDLNFIEQLWDEVSNDGLRKSNLKVKTSLKEVSSKYGTELSYQL